MGIETIIYEIFNREVTEKLNSINDNYQKQYLLALHADFIDYFKESMKDLSKSRDVKIDCFLREFHMFNYVKNGKDFNCVMASIKNSKKIYKELVIGKKVSYEELIDSINLIDVFFDKVELLICELWESIHESDIKFKTLTEITSASVFIHDGENFTFANKATEELTGYSEEELKNKKFWDVLHPEFQEILRNNGQARKIGELLEPSRYELKIITKQGKEKWIDINVGTIMLYGKRMILGIASSIAIRKRIQENLAANEEQLRTLINAMPDLVCFKDEEGRWLEANDFTINLFELDKNNYRGKKECEFNNKDNFYNEAFQGCILSDVEAMESGKIVHCEEYVPRRDGTYKIFDIVKVPLYYEDGGNRGIIVLGRDITERKRVERKLIESEERYRKVVEISPYGIFVGSKGKIIFSNEAGTKLLGYNYLEDIIFEDMYNFIEVGREEVNKVYSLTEGSYSESITKFKDIKFTRKVDGRVIDVEVAATKFPMKSNEDMLIIARDISERKRTEELTKEVEENARLLNEAMAYDKLKTEFFANISHELRTPLNVILSTMQLFDLIVNEDSIAVNENKIRRYINMTKQNCNRLLRLVNNLIDITKIDAGYFHLNYKNEDIVSIVEDITLSVAEYIENKGLVLQFDTDVEEKIIGCDSQIIERITLNLLSNAVKFTDANGNIRVNIYDKGDKIIISVKDTGIGIHKEKQNLIFERFVQVDKSLSRRQEGSGIGLSLVKSLVEMHNGRIWVESEYGEGSEFIVELPAMRLDQEVLDCSILSTTTNKERINVEFSDIYM